MKLAAIIAAVVISVLAIAYTVTFILVRAQVERDPGGLDFIMFVRDAKTHADTFGEQLSLPIENGAEYGWMCIGKSTSADLSWQESLTIPRKPASWEHRNLVTVSADGRTAHSSGEGVILPPRTFSEVLERLCFVKTVYWHNDWSVVAGDPPGDYVFTIAFNGKTLTRTIRLTPQ